MTNVMKTMRNSFFAGMLVVVPVAASVGILWWLFSTFTDWLLPRFVREQLQVLPYPEVVFRIIALIVFTVIVTIIGWVTRLVVGKRLVLVGELIIERVPLLNKIYGFVKEVSHTLLGGKKTVFERVVLIEYPRPGVHAIAFVTSETEGEVQAKTQSKVINVFLPTTPNPTSGFLLMIPREQAIDLEMSVAEGMKLVISGGAVVPPYVKKTEQPSMVAPKQM